MLLAVHTLPLQQQDATHGQEDERSTMMSGESRALCSSACTHFVGKSFRNTSTHRPRSCPSVTSCQTEKLEVSRVGTKKASFLKGCNSRLPLILALVKMDIDACLKPIRSSLTGQHNCLLLGALQDNPTKQVLFSVTSHWMIRPTTLTSSPTLSRKQFHECFFFSFNNSQE